MFCPFCGKQNQDNTLFCAYCGKALSQQNPNPPQVQAIPQTFQSSQKDKNPKAKISNTAKKAVITGILIVGLVIVVLLIYYPGLFHWNL